MRFWNDIQLQPKLMLAYLLGAVLPILIIGTFLMARLYAISFDSAMRAHVASLAQLRANYNGYLESCEQAMRSVIQDPKLLRYINTRHETDFDAIIGFLDEVRPLVRDRGIGPRGARFRVYTDNETIYFSQELGNSLESLAREPWYDPDADGSELRWVFSRELGGIDYGPMLGCYQPVMTWYYPSKVRRVCAMFFDEAPLHQLVSAERGYGHRVFLLDGRGSIVSTTERGLLFSDAGALDMAAGQSLLEAETGLLLRYADGEYYCLKARMAERGGSFADWQLVSLVPAAGVRDSVNRTLRSGLLLCACCLAFGLALIMLTARGLRRRVFGLTRNMNEVLESGFVKPVRVTGRDEIGDIERNFSALAEQTRNLIHEVYRANLDNARLAAENTEAQLIALRGQIDPHYLFNTLESIRMNLIVAGDRRTANIVQLFAESFRNCIGDVDDTDHDLGRELRFLRAYFAIHEYRTRVRVRLEIDVDGALLGYALPKLLLQPLVENAVYHGLELKDGAGAVRLDAREADGSLLITVRDDGMGMDECTLHKVRSALDGPAAASGGEYLALRNVSARLKLMYGQPYGLRIHSAPGIGTEVEVCLPASMAREGGWVNGSASRTDR